jgi:uncharacterized protein YjbI with pentapeptide repeats
MDGADLRECDLRECVIERGSWRGCDLRGTAIEGLRVRLPELVGAVVDSAQASALLRAAGLEVSDSA